MGERILINGYEIISAGEDLVEAVKTQIPVAGSAIKDRHGDGYFMGIVEEVYYDEKRGCEVVKYRPHTYVHVLGGRIVEVDHCQHTTKVTPVEAEDERGRLIRVVD